MEDYKGAVRAARRALQEHPRYLLPALWLTAALGQMDQVDVARREFDEIVACARTIIDRWVRRRVPWMRPQDYAHLLDGLRKVGWEG